MKSTPQKKRRGFVCGYAPMHSRICASLARRRQAQPWQYQAARHTLSSSCKTLRKTHHLFYECFAPCLFRACLGKLITFSSTKWPRKRYSAFVAHQIGSMQFRASCRAAACASPAAASRSRRGRKNVGACAAACGAERSRT